MYLKINQLEKINITQCVGKMAGIGSISTNTLKAIICNRHRALPIFEKMVCVNCYAERQLEYRVNTAAALDVNDIFKNRLLTKKEIRIIADYITFNYRYFRFESHGELDNETQLLNYIAIMQACKRVKFGLWSKNYFLILNYVKANQWPKNCQLVISSPFINEHISPLFMNTIKKYVPNAISFTVYSSKKFNAEEIEKIPGFTACGGKSCASCLNCYNLKNAKNVIEKNK